MSRTVFDTAFLHILYYLQSSLLLFILYIYYLDNNLFSGTG